MLRPHIALKSGTPAVPGDPGVLPIELSPHCGCSSPTYSVSQLLSLQATGGKTLQRRGFHTELSRLALHWCHIFSCPVGRPYQTVSLSVHFGGRRFLNYSIRELEEPSPDCQPDLNKKLSFHYQVSSRRPTAYSPCFLPIFSTSLLYLPSLDISLALLGITELP